jgi:transposase
MIEAILWKHRTGAPWRDVPEEFGPWNSVFTRFNRWSKAGLWQTILEALRIEADTEWLMIDATVIRAHQHAAGALKKKGYPARDSGEHPRYGRRSGYSAAIMPENPHRIRFPPVQGQTCCGKSVRPIEALPQPGNPVR